MKVSNETVVTISGFESSEMQALSDIADLGDSNSKPEMLLIPMDLFMGSKDEQIISIRKRYEEAPRNAKEAIVFRYLLVLKHEEEED